MPTVEFVVVLRRSSKSSPRYVVVSAADERPARVPAASYWV
jgi:hypothetical protein